MLIELLSFEMTIMYLNPTYKQVQRPNEENTLLASDVSWLQQRCLQINQLPGIKTITRLHDVLVAFISIKIEAINVIPSRICQACKSGTVLPSHQKTKTVTMLIVIRIVGCLRGCLLSQNVISDNKCSQQFANATFVLLITITVTSRIINI